MKGIILAGIILGCCLSADCAFHHTSCEDGWMAYGGNCYLIGHYDITFVEAEHFCRQHHGHVVEPYNELENKFIKDQFRYLQTHCYWIGTTDEMVEDVWRWYSSNDLTNFTDWYPGQPNHEGDQDCAVSWASYDFKWGDIKCNYKCNPVCKQRGHTDDSPEIIGKRTLLQ